MYFKRTSSYIVNIIEYFPLYPLTPVQNVYKKVWNAKSTNQRARFIQSYAGVPNWNFQWINFAVIFLFYCPELYRVLISLQFLFTILRSCMFKQVFTQWHSSNHVCKINPRFFLHKQLTIQIQYNTIQFTTTSDFFAQQDNLPSIRICKTGRDSGL